MLIVGGLLAAAVALAAYLAQESSQRAGQVERARDLLRAHRDNLEVVVAGEREKLDLAEVPELVKGTAAALVVAGILSMGFMGFAGLGR